jgi:hypothetical protein
LRERSSTNNCAFDLNFGWQSAESPAALGPIRTRK